MGELNFAKVGANIANIRGARSPTQLGANQSNPTARRAAVFAIFPDPTFYPTPIALPIPSVGWQNGFCLRVDEYGRYFGKSGGN